MLSKIKNGITNGVAWVYSNRIPLSILAIQYSAIIISIINQKNADLVLWIWGFVAFLISAIAGGTKYSSGLWFFLQLIFNGLLALAGYFYLP